MTTGVLQRGNADAQLSESTILAAVKTRSGLQDVGEASLGTRLQRLLAYLDRDVGLDTEGRRIAFDIVCELLVNRAKLLADRERYPAIREERIEAPLIVTGLPRSGTTLMHALLAADPANRAPRHWEVTRPSPPPGISPADDPRIAMADREVAEMNRQQPLVLQAHPYFDRGADTLAECEAIGTIDLHILYVMYFLKLPAVLTLNLMDDPVAYYRFHRMMHQALQWKRPARRWAMKGVEHHAYLSGLKQVYPDAIVVWLHRDPLKVVPSLMAILSCWFEGVIGKPVDRPVLGRQILAMYKGMLDAAMANPLVDHPDTCHVLYADFHADPIGQIEAVYKRYGLPFTTQAAAAMKAWYEDPANDGNRHGRFEYSLADFHMTPDELESEMSAYRARFSIPYER